MLAKFCSSCGESVVQESKYCIKCGASYSESLPDENKLLLRAKDRRFEYGSISFSESSEDVYVGTDSEELRRAMTPFDSTRIPSDGDMVPGNCIWAALKYPGPLPQSVLNSNFQQNIIGASWLIARPKSEINTVLGIPTIDSRARFGDPGDGGMYLSIYTEDFGFMKRQTRVAGVWFDAYHVGVAIEENVNKYL
ncbi:MAG: zinc ribbon domain-containing protein [Micrococcales bacterium]|nr:zinc ribbon domain-containing protein [Microbacteriaceae bacterium]NBR22998.1 zinc ribbon domain-containing protein [Micrococcales bacterium]NBX94531.1 zinc ribbon domain-containing protein [Actinomycetota bacterium]NBR77519.1 zinc ribbon domain-containing protein [Microbacteriaceae bacterium]NBS61126.1 zinc ribbon domain-containing protein [Microbacteriaceae bacterium]